MNLKRLVSLGAVLGLAGSALIVGEGTAVAADQTVQAVGFAFSPATVTVNVGDSVTWTNGDEAPHTATSTSGSPSFDTGTIAPGASASVTFTTAGTFSYVCNFHPNMLGTVVVQAAQSGGDASATATSTSTSTGSPAAPQAGTGTGDDGGGVNAAVIAGGIVAVLVVVGAGGFAFYRRRA